MKIGLIKEGKSPPDRRVAFTPKQCRDLLEQYEKLEIVVEPSAVRAIADHAYASEGLVLTEDLSNCDVLIGIKEVPIADLMPEKTYLFFSHTIKKQAYNRDLLRAILDKKIRLIDHELLVDKGKRLVGFGKYAGIVGAYNGLKAYGEKTKSFHLKPANQCEDQSELEQQLEHVQFDEPVKIVLTGAGRVGGGAVEILEKAGLIKVDPKQFLTDELGKSVFTQLSPMHYVTSKEGRQWNQSEFFEHPERFKSTFAPYVREADIYIACHFWDSKSPHFFSIADMEREDFQLKIIADISCDINGPIPSTIRSSTIEEPFYGYHRLQHVETDFMDQNAIGVMAVDNLPCELPKEASFHFGSELIKEVMEQFFNGDAHGILKRATIAENGQLTPDYHYLSDFVAS